MAELSDRRPEGWVNAIGDIVEPATSTTLASVEDLNDLARVLGAAPRRLRYLLYRLSPTRRYRAFQVAKRNGGAREIRAPILPLKRVQERVAALLAASYNAKSCVFGYVGGRNIQMNARRHMEKRWVLRVDIKDFFPSINFGRVRGMLKAPPFSLSPAVATMLAQICSHENQLPQGSPASPIISNLICRGLDHKLSQLARTRGCTYTRYCDDLVFSTKRKSFPPPLAERRAGGSSAATVLGAELESELKAAGFSANPDKVHLCHSSQRQMVTGLVVNAGVNLPRKYLRELRMVLHVWRKLGPSAAAEWYLTKHDRRNRPPGKAAPSFRYIVRGKVQYVGSVRGWGSAAYIGLATKLQALDPSFKPHADATGPVEASTISLRLYVEGRTDKSHIALALAALQRAGRYRTLRLEFVGQGRGSSELLTLCKNLATAPQTPPCVCVFDADEPGVLKDVLDGTHEFKSWDNSVYSVALPRPAHRADADGWCIEMLYHDEDLRRVDDNGRRVYLREEFNQKCGQHLSVAGIYRTNPKERSLVAEQAVFRMGDPTDLALAKAAFVKLIERQPESAVNYEGFGPLFDALLAVGVDDDVVRSQRSAGSRAVPT